jgi:hypothetical protein
MLTIASAGLIQNGALEVIPNANALPPGTLLTGYLTQIDATFSQPVTDVSLMAFCYRFGEYYYSGVDGNGVPFSSWGYIPGQNDGEFPTPGWETFQLNVPNGGYLTDFELLNADENYPYDAALWVNDISFTPVPEYRNNLLIIGGMLLLPIFRSMRKKNALKSLLVSPKVNAKAQSTANETFTN